METSRKKWKQKNAANIFVNVAKHIGLILDYGNIIKYVLRVAMDLQIATTI
jgi:hypothetical protein